MLGVVLRGHSGGETNLHLINITENALHSPSRDLVEVVLEFSGDDGTSAGVELVLPLGGAVLVENTQVEGSAVRSKSVDLGSEDEVKGCSLRVVRKVELLVLVGVAQDVGVVVREGVGLVGDLALGVLSNSIGGKVLVNQSSLKAKVCGRVDVVLVGGVSRRVSSVLVDGDEVERTTLSLVKEELLTLLGDDNIPRSHGLGGAHDLRQNGVSDEDSVGRVLGELLHDGVLRGGGVEHGSAEVSELGNVVSTVELSVVGEQVSVGINLHSLGNVVAELLHLGVSDLLDLGPVVGNVDGGVSDSLGLVKVSPSELALTKSRVGASLATNGSPAGLILESASSLGTSSSSERATSGSTSSSLENGGSSSGLVGVLGVVNHGER